MRQSQAIRTIRGDFASTRDVLRIFAELCAIARGDECPKARQARSQDCASYLARIFPQRLARGRPIVVAPCFNISLAWRIARRTIKFHEAVHSSARCLSVCDKSAIGAGNPAAAYVNARVLRSGAGLAAVTQGEGRPRLRPMRQYGFPTGEVAQAVVPAAASPYAGERWL